MRATIIALSCLVALCLAAVPHVRAEDDEGENVRKTGRLVVVTDAAGEVTSATLVSAEKDAWDDEISYKLVLNAKTRKLAQQFKGKTVLVAGTLQVDEDDLADRIVVATITAAAEKAAAPAAPAAEKKVEDDLF